MPCSAWKSGIQSPNRSPNRSGVMFKWSCLNGNTLTFKLWFNSSNKSYDYIMIVETHWTTFLVPKSPNIVRYCCYYQSFLPIHSTSYMVKPTPSTQLKSSWNSLLLAPFVLLPHLKKKWRKNFVNIANLSNSRPT